MAESAFDSVLPRSGVDSRTERERERCLDSSRGLVGWGEQWWGPLSLSSRSKGSGNKHFFSFSFLFFLSFLVVSARRRGAPEWLRDGHVYLHFVILKY